MEEVIRSNVQGVVFATGLDTEGTSFFSTCRVPLRVGPTPGHTVFSKEQRQAGSKLVSVSFPGTVPSTLPRAHRGSLRVGDNGAGGGWVELHTLLCSHLVLRVATGLNPSPGQLSG